MKRPRLAVDPGTLASPRWTEHGGTCHPGPSRWRERCRWTLPATGGRCVRFDRRPMAEQRRARAMLGVALGLAMGGLR